MRQPLKHSTAIVFAALPFAFALVRAIRTGYDLRYLWVALASLCGAIAIVMVTRVSSTGLKAAAALWGGVFVVATLVAVFAALLLGTRLGPGILVVASAFGFCFAVGSVLYVLSVRSGREEFFRRRLGN